MILSGSLSSAAVMAKVQSGNDRYSTTGKIQKIPASISNVSRNAAFFLWRAGFFLVLYATYIVPPLWMLHTYVACPFPTLVHLVTLPVMTVFLIGVPMSVCLHRYFSHQAFKTTRAFQFVLGVVACFGFQNGPLWWAGKHNRHHRTCDTAEDPHSWIASGSWLWSWIGWTMHNKEAHYDMKYIPAKFRSCPELWVLDTLCYPICFLAWLAVYQLWGYQTMVYCAAMPMLMCRLLTLGFNLYFHPEGAKIRDEGGICAALDRVHRAQGLLANTVGESHHLDHHKHPTRMHRPGYDIPYHITIRWWLALGLIWETKPVR